MARFLPFGGCAFLTIAGGLGGWIIKPDTMPTEEWRKLSQEKKDLEMEKAAVKMKWEEWDSLVESVYTPTTADEREMLCKFAEIEHEEHAKVKIYQERGWYQEPIEDFEECLARFKRLDEDYANNKDLREAKLRIEFRQGQKVFPQENQHLWKEVWKLNLEINKIPCLNKWKTRKLIKDILRVWENMA